MDREIEPGQVIVIATDGVWESQDSQGRMFGKERVGKIIRDNVEMPAGDILSAFIEAIEHFRGSVDREDDVTLVIIKIV